MIIHLKEENIKKLFRLRNAFTFFSFKTCLQDHEKKNSVIIKMRHSLLRHHVQKKPYLKEIRAEISC